MNPDLLLAHFNRLSDAPDAVPRLQRFILDLAVRGRLVEQNANEESASELLARIQTEKTRLEKEGKIRKQEPTLPVNSEEQPFQLPASWKWVRFGYIADFSAGRTPSRHDFSFWNTGDYSWVSIADMKDGGDVVTTKETISAKAKNQVFGSEPAPVGTMIMSFKLTIGKISRLGIPAFHNEAIISIRPHLPEMEAYLFQVLPEFSREGNTKGAIKGATLNRDSITNIFLPIPPLAEQRRIVAKVNELMAVCERLESAHAEHESRRHRLAATSLHHLTNGADAEASSKHAQFCLSHLPEIASGPEDIPALRQAILSLGAQGKLVQQNPEDGSPESLLSKVREIRKNSANRSKTSSVNDSDPKFVQHLPKNLPHGWSSCPLEELFKFIDYRGRTPTRTARGVRLITAKNVRMGYVANDPVEYIDERAYKAWMTRGFPRNGDLLFVTEGATMGFVGTIELQFEFALAQRTIDLQPYLPSYSRFFFFTIMSPLFQEAVLTNSTGTAVKGIKAAKLKRIRVPLPPLAEQERIVVKVVELMALCDRLEAQLTTAQTEAGRLLESVLHNALNQL